jgi:hypothetical protein
MYEEKTEIEFLRERIQTLDEMIEQQHQVAIMTDLEGIQDLCKMYVFRKTMKEELVELL